MENRLWVITATLSDEVVYSSEFNGWGSWEDADIYTDDQKAQENDPFTIWLESSWLEYR